MPLTKNAFDNELGTRLTHLYGPREQWPASLALAAAWLGSLPRHMDREAFDSLLRCALEAHQEVEEIRARDTALRSRIQAIREREKGLAPRPEREPVQGP